MVGARSALFLPYANLGLIIVDEEHDQAYKQDEGVHYHARDMAVVRAHIAKIPIVLASATPSVEIRSQCAQGALSAHRAAVALRRPAHAAYRGDRPAPRAAGARPLHLAASRRRDQYRDRTARAGTAVPQSPRLCAADVVPCLRPSFRLHDLRRVAGRSSLPPAAGLSPLRLLDAAPANLPAMRGRGIAGRRRARRRAFAGGSGRAVSRCAHHGAVERSR